MTGVKVDMVYVERTWPINRRVAGLAIFSTDRPHRCSTVLGVAVQWSAFVRGDFLLELTNVNGNVNPHPPVKKTSEKHTPDNDTTSTIAVTHHAVFRYITLAGREPFGVVGCHDEAGLSVDI